MLHQILMAGFGGQGILSTGQLLTYAGMVEDKYVAWIPSYGPEMRGGTANCGVTISDIPISSPMVTEPTAVIIMNEPSLNKFVPTVKPGGLVFINESLVQNPKIERDDLIVYKIPANELAEELGNFRVGAIVMLGAVIAVTDMVSFDSVEESLRNVLPPHRHKLIPLNRQALEKGAEYIK